MNVCALTYIHTYIHTYIQRQVTIVTIESEYVAKQSFLTLSASSEGNCSQKIKTAIVFIIPADGSEFVNSIKKVLLEEGNHAAQAGLGEGPPHAGFVPQAGTREIPAEVRKSLVSSRNLL